MAYLMDKGILKSFVCSRINELSMHFSFKIKFFNCSLFTKLTAEIIETLIRISRTRGIIILSS